MTNQRLVQKHSNEASLPVTNKEIGIVQYSWVHVVTSVVIKQHSHTAVFGHVSRPFQRISEQILQLKRQRKILPIQILFTNLPI